MKSLSWILVTTHHKINFIANLLNTLSWLRYKWEGIKVYILYLTGFNSELFTKFMRRNQHSILYSSSFNCLLSQIYSTFWSNNFNMIIVFKICKGEASSWNSFVFYVHCTTYYLMMDNQTGWNVFLKYS